MHHSKKLFRFAVPTLIVALSTALLFSGCTKSQKDQQQTGQPPNQSETTAANEIKQETYYIFDTIVTVKIYDKRATDQDFKNINDLLVNIENKMSRTLKSSELYKLNEHAGKGPYKVSADTFEVISKAIDYAQQTNGAFDPTVGPLVNSWNIGHEDAHVPPQAEIDADLPLVGYEMVQLDEANQTVTLEKPGMVMDLGGIAKGYAADVIANYIREAGYNSAIVDLGGNIYAVGEKPGGLDWTIGVQDPNETRGNPIGKMKVKDKTIVTSGVYERYFVENGKHYHHILDRKTGYPVDNNLNSVTIVTDKSTDADALSTAIFSLGIEKGLEFIESKTDAEAIFITKDQKVYMSSGISKIFELTNDAYTIATLDKK
ncbi:FAD:protein FMN transferase [Paenibacillus marinisediminis]